MKKKQFFKELQKRFEIKKNLNEEMLLIDINFDSLRILEMITLKEMYFKKIKSQI